MHLSTLVYRIKRSFSKVAKSNSHPNTFFFSAFQEREREREGLNLNISSTTEFYILIFHLSVLKNHCIFYYRFYSRGLKQYKIRNIYFESEKKRYAVYSIQMTKKKKRKREELGYRLCVIRMV